MAISVFKFVTDGEKSFRENIWASTAHYWCLVKNAHTPAMGNITYSTFSANEATDSGYDQLAVTGKALLSNGAIDCDDINFSVNVNARYLYLVKGTAASPQAGDQVIGFYDLNDGGSSDLLIDAGIVINAAGVVTYTPPSWS